MGLLIQIGFKQIINYIKNNKLKVFGMLAFIVLLILPYASLNMEFNSGGMVTIPSISLFAFTLLISAFFLMLSFFQADSLGISQAEANIFFVSPIKEHHILTYVLIKSSYQVFIFIVAFTGANLTFISPFFGFTASQFFLFLLWELLLFTTNMLLGVFLFLVKKKSRRIFYGILGLSLFFLVLNGCVFLFSIRSIWSFANTFNTFFTQPYWSFIPLLGWFANASSIVYGVSAETVLAIILIIAVNILFFLSPYYIRTSVAEAAIDAAEKNFKRRQRVKAGNKFAVENKSKGTLKIRFSGVKAIISKQWIEYRRNSRFLMTGSIFSLMMVMAVYIVIYKFTAGALEGDGWDGSYFLSMMLLIVLSLVSILLPSDVSKDVSNPVIFLIPEKPYKKLLAISVMSNFENMIKTLLIVIFQVFTDIPLATGICLSIIYFVGMSTASCVDLFFNFVFKDNVLTIVRTICSSIAKIFILAFLVSAYILLLFLMNREISSLVSFPSLAVVVLLALAIDFFIIYVSQGIVTARE